MKTRVLLLTLLMVNFVTGFAQFKVKMNGTVVDKESGDPLIAATVKATLSNGTEETFSITNDKGVFNIDLSRPGSYDLEFSYIGYKKVNKTVNIRPGDNTVGRIRMTEETIELKGTDIIGKNMRVKQMGDTTVYNADGYKVMDGATAEDLIAKMPGMKVSDGKVEAQGEEVKKIYVDGKSFFENDPTLALRTLPAEVVQSVALFDKKSEQAEFTGFDDGNSVKAIDLRTRSYKREGMFGKIYGQYGTDNKYNFGGNLNIFSGDRRITLLGLFNNVNQQNFSIDDILGAMPSGGGPRGSRGGGPGMPPPGSSGGRSSNMISSQNGVTTANAIGLNYTDTWGDKIDVQGSYFFNMTKTSLKDSLNRNYFDTIAGIRTYDEISNSLTKNYSHRMNARISYKPSEKDEILFMPNMSFQKNNSNSISTGVTFLDGEELNSSETTKHTESHGYNISGELLWRHKFNKDGRTFSANIKGGLNKNDSESDQTIILNGVSTEQKVDNNSNGHNYGANLMYTEPISDNQQLSLSYNANFTNSTTDKITDEIAESGISHDPYLTSNYSSDYFTQSAGAGYRLNSEKIRFMVNLNYQRADLNGHQYFPYKDEMNYKTSKSFNSFLPMVMFDFIPEQNKSLRFMYRSSSTSPSVTQLQQTIDNSNPLQLSQGNPELDQIVDHTLSVRYITSNIDKATNWMFNVNLTKKFDYIGSSVFIADEELTLDNGLTMVDGAQMTTPVNLNGYLSTGANASFGFPLDFIMSNMNVSAAINYIKTPGIQNDVKLNTKSLSVVPGLSITSNISQDIDFTLNYDIDFQKVKNTINKESNYNYLTHSANAKVNWVIWNGIIFENNLNWKYYGGSSMDKAEQIWRWNVSIGKKFLKNNRAELKVIAYDILNQNRSFSRTVTDTYIQNSYTNVLGRYFMLSLTYNLQNFKKTTPKT